MSTENKSAAEAANFSGAVIISFIKKYWRKIMLFSAFTFVITLLVIGILYYLLPKTDVYALQIGIQLADNDGKIVYPSLKIFSANDIISAPVMRKIYHDNKLEKKIKFNNFCKLFYVSGYNIEKAALAASYRGKLESKKLTVIELKELEREYQQLLRGLDTRSIEICMRNSSEFDTLEAVRLLNSVPMTWFELYSIQEAKVLPQFHTAAQVKELRSSLEIDGWLITLDKIRKLCQDLNAGCSAINEMLQGRQIALPTGEYLKELHVRLDALTRHRLGIIMQIVQLTPSYHYQFDQLYLNSNIVALDRRINAEKAKYAATVDAINIIHPASTEVGRKGVAADQNGPVTLNLDGTFFNSVAELVRTASTIELREKYANIALEQKTALAELEEEKNYYMGILSQISGNNMRRFNISKEQLQKIEQNLFAELFFLCTRLNEFKIMMMKDFRSSRQFFYTTGEVLKMSQFKVSFAKLTIGIVLIFLLINFIYAGRLFFVANSRGELKK